MINFLIINITNLLFINIIDCAGNSVENPTIAIPLDNISIHLSLDWQSMLVGGTLLLLGIGIGMGVGYLLSSYVSGNKDLPDDLDSLEEKSSEVDEDFLESRVRALGSTTNNPLTEHEKRKLGVLVDPRHSTPVEGAHNTMDFTSLLREPNEEAFYPAEEVKSVASVPSMLNMNPQIGLFDGKFSFFKYGSMGTSKVYRDLPLEILPEELRGLLKPARGYFSNTLRIPAGSPYLESARCPSELMEIIENYVADHHL